MVGIQNNSRRLELRRGDIEQFKEIRTKEKRI